MVDLNTSTSLIEGIANEVLICVAILLAGLILVIAWISTHVQQDSRPIAVFVFENLGRFQRSSSTPPSTASPSEATVPPDASPPETPTPESTGASAEVPETVFPSSSQEVTTGTCYDVDFLDSDCSIDTETRQHVEEVIQEYTEVIEARNESDLRNRRLKYFNCLLPDRPSTSTDETATASEAAAETPVQTRPVPVAPVMQVPGNIQVKLKYFNDDLKTVLASPTESIATFKQKHFQTELARNMNIRLIYNGRELKEGSNRTLESYCIPEAATIHCLITERREEASSDADGHSAGSSVLDVPHDIGGLMFPLFGVILGLIWYCRICYRIYFNFLSTLALSAVTLLFFAACLASWTSRHARQNQQPIQVHRINLETPQPAAET